MTMVELKEFLAHHVLSDIDICYLETLSFNNKFNLVILHSDHTHRNIENIENIEIEDIKEQLSAKSIKYAEGLPLNWSQIMRSVREDPKRFRDAGGWDFLHNMEVDWLIKMEPVSSLSCSSCDEKVTF